MAFLQVSDHSIAHFQPPPSLHREHYFAGGGFQRLHQRVYASPLPGYFYDDSNVYINMLPFQNSLDMNMITPTYHQPQNNNPTYSQPQRYYYNSNMAPRDPSSIPLTRGNSEWMMRHFDDTSVHDHFINIGPRGQAPSAIPSRRTHDNGRRRVVHQDQIIYNQTYNAEWMSHGYDHYVQDFTDFEDRYWIQEDEAMIMDAIESTHIAGGLSEVAMIMDSIESTHSAGGLSEELIFKHLKTSTCDKENEGSEICIVCQDDLCQEDEMIGMLGCGHNYHATCIKKWLQEKNACPLCKCTVMSRKAGCLIWI